MDDFNFGDICRDEPGLGDLFTEALERKQNGIKGMNVWYREFKPRMERMVGMMRDKKPDYLKTSEAYNIVYHTIYNALTGGIDKEAHNVQDSQS